MVERCSFNEGCCFCDGLTYKRCTFCGHLTCVIHCQIDQHLCSHKTKIVREHDESLAKVIEENASRFSL